MVFATQSFQCAVVGRQISYSQSPNIHQAFAKQCGLSMRYTIEEAADEAAFVQKIKSLQAAGFRGCNITVPFKEVAFRLADEATERAKLAGAANTFIFESSGLIKADNTDGIGFVRDVTERLNFSLFDKTLLICGAGGAVRGICYPLIQAGVRTLCIVNRTVSKAVALVSHFSNVSDKTILQALTEDQLEGWCFDMVVNGTPVRTGDLSVPDVFALAPNALVYDLKYGDNNTPMLRWGKARGARCSEGMGMLIEQAAEAFFLWTGYRVSDGLAHADCLIDRQGR